MKLDQVIEEFLTQAIESGGWMALDRLYLRNRVYAILEITPDIEVELTVQNDDYLGALMVFQESRQLRSDQLADLLTPPPSVVNALFAQRYEKDPYDATAYFYQLNQLNKRVAPVQESIILESTYGDVRYYHTQKTDLLETGSYPKCQYCMENEGYDGVTITPSQLTQRMIRMNLQGTTWNYHFEVAPYWSEACVFTSEHHETTVDLSSKVEQLNSLNNLFPHYFVASLGAFTSHPAYFGGVMKLPVSLANSNHLSDANLFKGIEISEVNWPVTTIRMRGENPQALKGAVAFFLTKITDQELSEPIIIFSDQEEIKQVDMVFVNQLPRPELALGILAGTDKLSDFENLRSFDIVKEQQMTIKEALQEL